jgi:hypothetical protein
MPVDSYSFVFIIALAGVVNGLGIVRWLSGFTEFLRRRSSLRVPLYWVFTLTACFQFLLHILFWWSLWGMRGTATINFLSYLYLLSGPILLFVATALLMPDIDEDEIDLRAHYFSIRSDYSTILVLLWLWAIFSGPLLRGTFAPTVPIFLFFLANAVVMRATANPTVHGVSAIVNWVVFAALIGLHFLQLGSRTI